MADVTNLVVELREWSRCLGGTKPAVAAPMRQAADAIEQLTRERDEARSMLNRGRDVACALLTDERDFARRERDEAIAELREARDEIARWPLPPIQPGEVQSPEAIAAFVGPDEPGMPCLSRRLLMTVGASHEMLRKQRDAAIARAEAAERDAPKHVMVGDQRSAIVESTAEQPPPVEEEEPKR